MTDAIGPGTPLICVLACSCESCGEGVTKGSMYTCSDLFEPGKIDWILHGPCACGEVYHPFVVLVNKMHAFCPNLFSPLGDPDAVIKETDEPSSTKRREDEGYETKTMPEVKRIKETENV